MEPHEIERRLEHVLLRAPAGVPAEQLASMLALTRSGQPAAALTQLSSQLDAYRVQGPAEVLAEIRALGCALGVTVPDWVD
jgi:hypothetical protein